MAGSYSYHGQDASLLVVSANKVGGYDDGKPKRKRYIVKNGDRLLVFNDKAEALNALPRESKAKPIQTYDLPVMMAKTKNFTNTKQLQSQIDFIKLIKEYEKILDDEDVELLLMA